MEQKKASYIVDLTEIFSQVFNFTNILPFSLCKKIGIVLVCNPFFYEMGQRQITEFWGFIESVFYNYYGYEDFNDNLEAANITLEDLDNIICSLTYETQIYISNLLVITKDADASIKVVTEVSQNIFLLELTFF